MSTSIKLMLNKNRKLKDGRYPLVIRVIHCRRVKMLYTGYRMYENEFNESVGEVLPGAGPGLSASKVSVINREIKQKKKAIQKRVRQLESTGLPYSVDDLFHPGEENIHTFCLLEYIDRQIKEKQMKAKEGTAAAYRSTRASLAKYVCNVDMCMEKVDRRFVLGYIDFLIQQGIGTNTVCYYLRNLRTLYNRAVSDGLRTDNEYPFIKISTRPVKTVKRAISRKDMEVIANLLLSETPEIELSRDLYLFSFYAQGMSFVDIVFLKKENIVGGMIAYNRHKSKQLIRVVVTPQMNQMIEKYAGDGEYVFPIINANSSQSVYHQYRLALSNINRHLRKIEIELGLRQRITTYTARHTWATLAHDYGAPISVISAALGHASEEMTRVYLNELDSKILNQVNLVITNLSINKKNFSS